MRTAGILLATVFLVSGFFLFYRGTSTSRNVQDKNEVVPIKTEGNEIVEGPILGTNVSDVQDKGLLNEKGNHIGFEEFKGKPMLLSFIYTSCPDPKMCPLLTEKMVRVQEKVNSNDKLSVQFVSITFDPETDTPETLKFYGEQKNVNFKNWSFLTGPADTINQLMDRFQIKKQQKSKNDDVMLHNMRTYLLDRDLTVKYAWRTSNWTVDDVFEKIKTLQ